METETRSPAGRRRRLAIGCLIALALVLLAGVALGGSTDTYIPQLGITVPDEKVEAVLHSLPPGGPETPGGAPVPAGSPDRIPAQMLAADAPVPISTQVLKPANAWLVSDGATLVAVYAGAAANNPSNGRFVIVRQNLAIGRQTEDTIDVTGTGLLRITAAPRGAAVETSAQRGKLRFRGSNGTAGVLDLATDRTRKR
jgi:hypothetical protein